MIDPLVWPLIGLVIICVTLVALIRSLEQSNASERRARAEAYDRTFRELADRIQAPERLPWRPEEDLVAVPEREPDEWNQVGQIHIDENYLTADD